MMRTPEPPAGLPPNCTPPLPLLGPPLLLGALLLLPPPQAPPQGLPRGALLGEPHSRL